MNAVSSVAGRPLCESLVQWLLGLDSFELHNIDAAQPDICDYLHLPDTTSLASKPKSSLQEANEVPQLFTHPVLDGNIDS